MFKIKPLALQIKIMSRHIFMLLIKLFKMDVFIYIYFVNLIFCLNDQLLVLIALEKT